jgi:hypothetical protein
VAWGLRLAGSLLERRGMIPDSYDLKRRVAQHRHRFWCGDELRQLIVAPVYWFTDQEQFDSDEVDLAARRISTTALRLPHRNVLFEVKDRGHHRRALVAYAWETGAGVEAVLLTRLRACRRWSDVQVRAAFRAGGWAEFEGNPRDEQPDETDVYVQCLTGMVWRAVAVLAEAGSVTEQTVSKIHRPKLAGAGVRGWTWHQVEIVPERLVRSTAAQDGTHASPRWHVRRGHWRQLADGRRVFVRACEVGDPERGGVLKDYVIKGCAA